MPLGWERLCRKALQEQDDGEMPSVCDHARRAINTRLTELAAQKIAADEEREQLYEALRRLLIHEHKLWPPN